MFNLGINVVLILLVVKVKKEIELVLFGLLFIKNKILVFVYEKNRF